MIKFNKNLDRYGFPKNSTPNNKIQIKYENKIFLFSKFKRRFDLSLKLFSFNLIDQYYHDYILDNFYYSEINNFKIFEKFSFKINLKIFIIFSYIFLKKDKIFLKKNEIVLLGPYSHSYFHVLSDFFLRLIYLSNIKFKNTIWVPDNLKNYIKSKTFKAIFKKLNFRFFSTEKNIEFKNCSYLTHPNTRWYIRNNKKKNFTSI